VEELEILRYCFPKYGVPGVLSTLESCGYRRSAAAVTAMATCQGLRRAPFGAAEDRILREGMAAGLYLAEIAAKLAEAGWSRDVQALGKRARELGIWRPRPTPQATGRVHEDRMRSRLRGGPYRELTDITPWLIRLYHSRGDSAEYLVEDMNRPLWFVQAVIAGEPWEERWRQERIVRGLEEASA